MTHQGSREQPGVSDSTDTGGQIGRAVEDEHSPGRGGVRQDKDEYSTGRESIGRGRRGRRLNLEFATGTPHLSVLEPSFMTRKTVGR